MADESKWSASVTVPPVFDALAMTAGLALLAVVAVTGPAVLGIRGRAAMAAAGLVLGATTIVGASVVLSFMRDLTCGGLLLSQLIVAGVSVGLWARVPRRARPSLRCLSRRQLVAALRAHPFMATLAAVVLATLGLEFVLAVAVAPNNWDSMGYHLSRAAYWLQYKSVFQFPGGTIRQLDYPPNGEILQAWTLSLSGTDRFAQLIQWASGIGCGLCIYLGAVLLGFRRTQAVFAAGLFLVLPIVVLESTTTQNDLITAFFVAATAVFAVRGLATRSHGDLVVAALALGLSVGTKGTVLIALPSLAILVGAAAWRHRPPLKFALRGLAITVLAVTALGSFNYIQSWEKTGSLFGNASHLTKRTDRLVPNALRSAWTFVELPGMQADWLDTAIQRPARAAFGDLEKENYAFTGTPTHSLDTRVQEDFTAFGPVGWLFLLPMLMLMLVWPKVDRRKRLVAACALLFLGLFFAVLNFNPWLGRLLIVFVVLAAPLMAAFARHPALSAAVTFAALSALGAGAARERTKAPACGRRQEEHPRS